MNTGFRKYLIGTMGLLIVLFILAGIRIAELREVPGNKQVTGYPVETVLAESRTISKTLDYLGTVEAWEEIDLTPKISATIIGLSGKEGDVLSKGQVAITLNSDELSGKTNTLEKKVQAAKVNADYWVSQVKLYESLYKGGAIAEQEFRKIVLNRDNAVNGFEEAQAAFAEAKLAAQNSIISAPMSGTIIRTYSYPGDLALPGKPILTMADTSKLKVTVKVAEEDLQKLKEGGLVLLAPAEGEKQYEAKITEIYPSVDRNLRTGTVDITLPQKVKEDYGIKPGMSLNTYFVMGKRQEAVVIPKNTVLTDKDNGTYVFVVENGKAVKKPVELGFGNDEFIEVTGGLKKGDRLVSSGLVEVYDGRPLYLTGEKG